VFVSAHPDVILKMGTKEVLVRTREMEWGSDTRLYRTPEEMGAQLPDLLRSNARVLKQLRGNGGNGVWKVQLVGEAPAAENSKVEVLHALRGSRVEQMSLGEFMGRCADYFEGSSCVIDQPYQERLGEGMIRCYMSHDKVVGFGHQMVTALLPPPPGTDQSPTPPPRLYYGPEEAQFQSLKSKLESRWIAEMQGILRIGTESLPVIWDADFLIGPPDSDGADAFVLCEINVSSVFPIPDEAPALLARSAVARAKEAGARRRP
jgi:hypothetical protein